MSAETKQSLGQSINGRRQLRRKATYLTGSTDSEGLLGRARMLQYDVTGDLKYLTRSYSMPRSSARLNGRYYIT